MKKTFFNLFLIFCFFLNQLSAQISTSTHYSITKNGFDKISITFTSPSIKHENVVANNETYSQIFMDDFFNSREVGNPTLPVMVKMVEIPLCDSIILTYRCNNEKIISGEELGISTQLLPAQPSYPKSYKGDRKFVKNSVTYLTNEFYGTEVVRVAKVGVLRNINMATIYVSPVQYNPVTNEFKIYDNIDVDISFENSNISATYEMKKLHNSQLFAETPVINPISLRTKDEITQAPIKYLIVSHASFRGELEEFIAWKKRKGFLVEVAYTDEPNVGTTFESIQSFIRSTYSNATPQNPAPSYVLLVGDVDQIPAKRVSMPGWFGYDHVTDLYYFTWTEGDSIPDCYYGRFSANSVEELRPQIEKTLIYEKYTMPDPSYLDKVVLIAGTDRTYSSTYADGQINYIASNYCNTDYGFSTIYKHNYNCSSEAATIREEIGNGVGLANYTAHGDVTEWYDPSFKASHINSMQNEGKYGVMIGNCCLSNKFDETSFGESLVRANKKGALAYIGASDYTYWDEDFYWAVGVRSTINANMTYNALSLGLYDRLFHTHNEPYTSWFTTLSAMVMAGDLAVESSSSEEKRYYWEVYHLLGDPSTMMWLTQPQIMTVSHTPLNFEITNLTVHAVPYAYVAITDSLQLIAAGFADANGDVILNFPALNPSDNIELTASAQNYQTYFKTIQLTPQNISDNQWSVTIYPNPANEYIVIQATDVINSVEIFDMMGKLVKTETNIAKNRYSINLNDFHSGIYFLKIINSANETLIKKIIKN